MELKKVFEQVNRPAVAFSGGVDSAYLLYEAVRSGADIRAYYVKSQFQPAFEYEEARSLADLMGLRILEDGDAIEDGTGPVLRILSADVLADRIITQNPADRCYYCKNKIMGVILGAAEQDGCSVLFEGTNASDDIDDRPGYRALTELGIRSPLRECGLTKSEIRERLHAAGLPVWNKPAYACLATRIPSGEEITARKLEITEKAETALSGLGFTDFRVRMRGDSALVQVRADQYDEAVARRNEITEALSAWYPEIRIDDRTR